MSSVGVVDRNVEMVNVWLGEITERLGHGSKEDAWSCLNAVLRTVRDRLPVDETADFAAQLPTLIRGSYYEGWRPSEAPHKWRHKDEYLAAVRGRLGGRENFDPEATVRAVLSVINRHVSEAEVQKIKAIHPKELWDLWPA
jgi:uncharacterized protein (DUF2267 family)